MKTLRTELVPIELTFETEHQSRFDYDAAEMGELAETMRTTGQLQNGVGRLHPGGRVEIFIGCRRRRASIAIGSTTFEVKIVEATDAEVLKANLIENAQRVNLKPLESAKAAERMLALRNEDDSPMYNERTLAAEIGKDFMVVNRWLSLLKAPEDVRVKVNRDALSLEVGAMIGALPPMLHDFAVDGIVNRPQGPMGRDEARKWIADHCRRDLRRATFDKTDEKLLDDAPACEKCPLWGGNRDDVEGKNKVHVCLGPDCYQRKQSVAALMEAARAGAENVEMIHEAEALKLFDDNNELNFAAPYVDLKKRPEPRFLTGGEKDKAPLWGTILKDSGAMVYLAIDGAGTPRHLARLEEALAAARMETNPHHVIFVPEVNGQGSMGDGEGETSEARKEKKRLDDAEKKGQRFQLLNALGDFHQQMKSPFTTAFSRALVKMITAPLPPDDIEMLAEAVAGDLSAWESPRACFDALVESGSVQDNLALAVLALVIHEAKFYGMEAEKIKALAPSLEFNREEWAKQIQMGGELARERAEGEGPKKKKKKGEPKMKSRSAAAERSEGALDNQDREKDGAIKTAAVDALPPPSSEQEVFYDASREADEPQKDGEPVGISTPNVTAVCAAEIVSQTGAEPIKIVSDDVPMLPVIASGEMILCESAANAKLISEKRITPKKKTSLSALAAKQAAKKVKKPAAKKVPAKKAAKKAVAKKKR